MNKSLVLGYRVFMWIVAFLFCISLFMWGYDTGRRSLEDRVIALENAHERLVWLVDDVHYSSVERDSRLWEYSLENNQGINELWPSVYGTEWVHYLDQ